MVPHIYNRLRAIWGFGLPVLYSGPYYCDVIIFTLCARACARSKVIGSVNIAIHTKIAKSQHLGILASGQRYHAVKIAKKLPNFLLQIAW